MNSNDQAGDLTNENEVAVTEVECDFKELQDRIKAITRDGKPMIDSFGIPSEST